VSRSGYAEADDSESVGLWRGAVARAINGKRGQAMLGELLLALDAMPKKELGADSLVTAQGDCCTLGALGAERGLDLMALDPEDADAVAHAFGVAPALVREIVYMNDEYEDGWKCRGGRWFVEPETAQQRWVRMRAWVVENLH
jgi:hypothetical protein